MLGLNKKISCMVGCLISLSVTAAHTHGHRTYYHKGAPHKHLQARTTHVHPWLFVPSLGYTQYSDMYADDGQTPLTKISFGKELFSFDSFIPLFVGVETGIQNGNTMRLYSDTLRNIGALPIQTTVKPIFDILATIKTGPIQTTPLFLQGKFGVGSIQWQFDNDDSVNNQNKFTAELQGGIGYAISQNLDLSILYQGFLGGRPTILNVDTIGANDSFSTIPVQNGVLLSMSIAFT